MSGVRGQLSKVDGSEELVLTADCVQGGVATNRVCKKVSISVATNTPFLQIDLLSFCLHRRI